MDFPAWFRAWITRHPVNTPTEAQHASYTAQVMERVRALGPLGSPARQPAPAYRILWWPRLAAIAATAAAVAFVVSTAARAPHAPAPIMATIPAAAPGSGYAVLAEDGAVNDEQWLEETLQLLQELDEDVAPASAEGGAEAEDEWLQDLELLDDVDSST